MIIFLFCPLSRNSTKFELFMQLILDPRLCLQWYYCEWNLILYRSQFGVFSPPCFLFIVSNLFLVVTLTWQNQSHTVSSHSRPSYKTQHSQAGEFRSNKACCYFALSISNVRQILCCRSRYHLAPSPQQKPDGLSGGHVAHISTPSPK